MAQTLYQAAHGMEDQKEIKARHKCTVKTYKDVQPIICEMCIQRWGRLKMKVEKVEH